MFADILIIGGGVSGSAMGAALVNSGHRVICIDQGTGGPLDTSRGDHISPVNVETIAEWGVLEHFFAAGATKRIGHQFRSSDGETLLSAEYTEMGIPYPYFSHKPSMTNRTCFAHSIYWAQIRHDAGFG